jgi:hypothetical protein
MSAAELYATLCAYVQSHGWTREEPGSGWWLHSGGNDAMLGEAVDSCLSFDGIDTRTEPAAAPVAPDALPCGHPLTAVVSADEGTSYCGACASPDAGTEGG